MKTRTTLLSVLLAFYGAGDQAVKGGLLNALSAIDSDSGSAAGGAVDGTTAVPPAGGRDTYTGTGNALTELLVSPSAVNLHPR